MSCWETSSTHEAEVAPADIWSWAYADVAAWPKWNAEIRSATLDGPLELGAVARIVFRTGLRLRFRVVEYEEGRLFTDEARLPGARMAHRHLVEPAGEGGSRLTNTIYIEGPAAWLWRRILGPAATRTLPDAQLAVLELGRGRKSTPLAERIEELHRRQAAMYAGGSLDPLGELLAEDVVWHVPGNSPIAGEHRGKQAVIEYFEVRRRVANNSMRLNPGELLAGEDVVVQLVDGSAEIAGESVTWRTVGIYRFDADRIAEAWLVPLDMAKFERIWGKGI